MGAGAAIVVVVAAFGAMYLFGKYKEEENIASSDPAIITSPQVESKPSSKCGTGCYSNGCKKCVKCGSSKCHNPNRNACYSCATQKCGRCSSSSKQTVTKPIYVENMAKGGTFFPTKKTIIKAPVQTVTKPIWQANKILRTRCIVTPYALGNFWKCYYPNGKIYKAGRDWKCKGLVARYQGLGHICYP